VRARARERGLCGLRVVYCAVHSMGACAGAMPSPCASVAPCPPHAVRMHLDLSAYVRAHGLARETRPWVCADAAERTNACAPPCIALPPERVPQTRPTHHEIYRVRALGLWSAGFYNKGAEVPVSVRETAVMG
jgi:hypothetical protein